jgi:hypothetical protein
MEALNDLVRFFSFLLSLSFKINYIYLKNRSGKVRYIGASSMWAWQFSKAQAIAEKRGWAK